MTICEGCTLKDTCLTPGMCPDESLLRGGPCHVLIVGEAPGEKEDQSGIPFVGPTGIFLRDVIKDAELDDFNIVFTNAVHCRPPENRTPTPGQIKACASKLLAEIEHYNPQLVMLLGNVPLKAALGEAGITSWRGSVLERSGRQYLPTFHPSYILRNTADLPLLVQDIDLARSLLAGDVTSTDVSSDYQLVFVDNVREAKFMHDTILEAGYCSVDTESNLGVKPFRVGTRPIMMSFAVNNGNGCKIAWAVTLLTGDSRIEEYCTSILWNTAVKKVLHNSKYDDQVIFAHYGKEIANIVGDSLLLSYMIDASPGDRHGLKALAGRYLGMYEYDTPLNDYYALHPEANPKKGGDMSLVPADVLASYAALDAVATLELHAILLEKVETPQQMALYQQLMLGVSRAVTHIEEHGLYIDDRILQRYIRVYEDVQAKQREVLFNDPLIRRYICDRQKALDKIANEPRISAKTGKALKPLKVKSFAFNPNSDDQMRDVLFGKRYANKKPLELTETGKPSIKWDWIKAYKDEVSFLKPYRYYELLDKMLGTYLRPAASWRARDNHIHQSIGLSDTATGRTNSKEPNSQNIPTPEKEPDTLLAWLPIKNIFTYSIEGGCLLAADYSAMELRTMATVSDCKRFIEIFENDQDPHSIVTTYLFQIPLDQVTKPLRYRAKWVNWTLLFGGSAYTLIRLYNLPKQEADHLVNMYYHQFPEVLENKDRTIAFARQHGYVQSPFGRRRYTPYINDRDNGKRHQAEREAVNMPIQSAASDILLCAITIIDEWLQESGLKTRIANTVHDSIMFDVYPGELDTVAVTVKDVMENLATVYGPKRFPGLDFSWFKVPLKADLEVGTHYGTMEHYDAK